MSIKILFFGQLREQIGLAETQVDLNETMSIADIKSLLISQESGQFQYLGQSHLLTALNHCISHEQSMVKAGDELAFFPPVTGG